MNNGKNTNAARALAIGVVAALLLVSFAGIGTAATFTNSIGMEFVQIHAGEFDMGSPSNEAGRVDYEGPVHRVKISKGFYLSKYEVTLKQWRDVMGTNPSNFKGDNLPVEQVSWNDAQEFITKLNEKEGANKYRLPSEAEWEYAARAGTTTKYSFGDDESKLGDYAWYIDNSGSKTHEIGTKKPNPWGLYDMHGNVWELVQDTWHGNYNGAPNEGSSWKSGDGSAIVLRGGGWNDPAKNCRSALRRDADPDYRDRYISFRLVIDSPVQVPTIPVLPTSVPTTSLPQTPTITRSEISASVSLHGEKTDVLLGEDILLKLSAVSLITKPKMHVQVIIIPPSGMSVTSSEFSKSGAGQFTSNYELNPGDGKDIEVRIKSNQIGDFNVNGRIIYYFEDEKDKGEDYTLNLPVKVRKEPADSAQNVQKPIPGFEVLIGVIGLSFAVFLKRRR